ncbi:hypothetical protein O6H91_Y407500 [Diphasiastrum complanatum]|nr:hypothetical protein O6H91_Y407500 [Diphasiastrum complanatum]
MMPLHERYEIAETASYILRRGFSRVALQFPDVLLKDSVLISAALQEEIVKQAGSNGNHLRTDSKQDTNTASVVEEAQSSVRLFVMADTTYGSCCADEVAAAHVNAESIIHYGHACLSQTSGLPVWFVFGKADIEVEPCASKLMELARNSQQPLLVFYGLEFAHAIPTIEASIGDDKIKFAELACKEMEPATTSSSLNGNNMAVSMTSKVPSKSNCEVCTESQCSTNQPLRPAACETSSSCCRNYCLQVSGEDFEGQVNTAYSISQLNNDVHLIGGLKWKISNNLKMEDYLIVWIGQESPAITNFILVYNACIVVRYDPTKQLQVDVANQSRTLKRRYYFVERAKDANIVGIVVGTLGVAGYKEVIQQIRNMVREAGKKSYTLLMGKPNPSKLANFPECDVFVLVACPETALLDSKEYFAPVLTPFEANLAFVRGQQWTGAYDFDFKKLFCTTDHEQGREPIDETHIKDEEPRFSFLKGTYVEMNTSKKDAISQPSSTKIVTAQDERAIEKIPGDIFLTGKARDHKSSSEYFVHRSFQGLELNNDTEKELQIYSELQNSLPPLSGFDGKEG